MKENKIQKKPRYLFGLVLSFVMCMLLMPMTVSAATSTENVPKVTGARWKDDGTYTAVWDAYPEECYYYIDLYKNGQSILNDHRGSLPGYVGFHTEYDLTPMIEEYGPGEYSFEIVSSAHPDGTESAMTDVRVFPSTEYNIWVNGKKLSSINRIVTCGGGDRGGTATLDIHTTPFTLTLENAKINNGCMVGDAICGIYTEEELNINLVGEQNTIEILGDSSRYDNDKTEVYGLYAPKGDIHFEGDGIIGVGASGREDQSVCGIRVNGLITNKASIYANYNANGGFYNIGIWAGKGIVNHNTIKTYAGEDALMASLGIRIGNNANDKGDIVNYGSIFATAGTAAIRGFYNSISGVDTTLKAGWGYKDFKYSAASIPECTGTTECVAVKIGNMNAKTVLYESAHKHSFTSYVPNKNATCFSKGTKTAVCDNGCGVKDTIIDSESKWGHDYSEWLDGGADVHKKVCANDPAHVLTREHDFVSNWHTVKEPTDSEPGISRRICYYCDHKDEKEIPAHTTIDGLEYEITTGANGLGAAMIGPEELSGNVVVKDVIVPGDKKIPVTKIAEGLFRANKNIVSVYIGDNITEIDPIAFAGCSNLEEVRLPDNLKITGVSRAMFTQCTSLRKVNIPSSWDYIPVFCTRPSLEEVVIPASVKRIEEKAFYGCTKIKKVEFGGTKAQWETLISDENCGAGNEALKNANLAVECMRVAPVITTQPSNAAVAEGATATFKIAATGDTLKYQWKKSTDGGKTWVNSGSTGATTNTLSMTTKASYNGLQFKCVVTDKNGETVSSNAATLTVKAGLAITTQPANATVTAGANVSFKIAATGDTLKYQWKKSTDGGKTWVNSSSTGATTNTLTMATKATYNGYKFKCVVTDKNGKVVESNAATLTVTAAGALAITTQPANATVTAGATATFKIAATGDTLKYQWKKSTDGGKTWVNSSSTGATTNTLTMATKASFNGLQFKCVVTDKNGKTVTSNAATLKVTAAAALAITAQPSDTIVLAGATAIFKITATGDTLKYQWKKSTDGGKTWVNSASTGATTNTLSMATKASYDGLQFKCVVTDKNGKTVTSNVATLKITSSAPGGVAAPAITTQPSNVTVTAGATATFKIAATGTGLKYQWKKSTDGGKTWVNSSSTGCTTNTLSMTTKASFNNLKFKCVVTDVAGVVVESNAVTLTVK